MLKCQLTIGKSIFFLISYIKDYDGGTLMEAFCNPKVNYSNISEIIKNQKDSLRGLIEKYLKVKIRRSYDDLEKIIGYKKVYNL